MVVTFSHIEARTRSKRPDALWRTRPYGAMSGASANDWVNILDAAYAARADKYLGGDGAIMVCLSGRRTWSFRLVAKAADDS